MYHQTWFDFIYFPYYINHPLKLLGITVDPEFTYILIAYLVGRNIILMYFLVLFYNFYMLMKKI
jgi:hypothetical protein